MLTFKARSTQQVQVFHDAACANEGTNEGEPGYRAHHVPGVYVAYVRDPDGNKLAPLFRDASK